MEELEHSVLLDDDQRKITPNLLKQRLTFIPFQNIRPFRKHPFRLYEGERLDVLYEALNKKAARHVKLPEGVFDMLTEVHGVYE